MRKRLLKALLLPALVVIFGQTGICQPTFVRFVKNGTEIMDKDNLTSEMREGSADTIQIYAEAAGGNAPYIVATGLQSRWCYFMSPSGAGSATLQLMPDDNAQGNFNITFETFDDNAAHGSTTATLALTVTDRNELGPDDTEVTIRNYPNPVKTTTTLEFVVPKAGYTTLKVYTEAGREVLNIIDNISSTPQRYFRKIDMSSFPPGTYVYWLKVDGVGKASGKLIKL